ncbi:hypothetical protein OHC33_006135 [Knufia fluminis]|uniref:AB hydrolase-1 domain-containing protein n=2 Tax=Knufia TaxID=430999 RepID=A0AAN8EDN7_9EURO|nr:hypothetical protein OHC33_006135 [Knufia fluminis]
MPFLTRNNIRLYYEVHGSPSSPPLILSHGYSATSEMWAGQIVPFSRDHFLITWDMRGHGQSDYPDDATAYSEDHTVADIAAILDTVVADKDVKVIVGGLSLGGYMSLAFYRQYPERVAKLLIIDTGPGFKKDAARDDWNMTANRTAESFERHGLKPLQKASAERRTVTHRNAKGLAYAARGMLAQRNDSVMQVLPEIKVPALIVVGSDDRPYIAASEYMSKKIGGSKKVVIEGAGHASNIDRPAAFNEAVLSFLASSGGEGKAKL